VRGTIGNVLEGYAADVLVWRLEEAVRRLGEATAGRERYGLSDEDADDVAGTVETDDAIEFSPLPLLRTLAEHGAVVAVMGQVAGIMHGSRELTGDLDLLWDGDRGQASALAAAFAAAGAVLADAAGRPVPCEPAAFGLPKVLFRSAFASGDCCTPALPWGDLPVAGFLARCRLAVARDGLVIRYLLTRTLHYPHILLREPEPGNRHATRQLPAGARFRVRAAAPRGV
jgi:hypothetical protein